MTRIDKKSFIRIDKAFKVYGDYTTSTVARLIREVGLLLSEKEKALAKVIEIEKEIEKLKSESQE